MSVVRLFLFLVACTITVACGGTSPAAPNAPSALTSLTAPALDADAASTDPTGTASLAAARGGRHDDDVEDDEEHGKKGEHQLSGFVTSLGTSSLVVRGITVTVDGDTVIRHGYRILPLADIEVGDHVEVRGSMTGTTLVATEIKVEDTGDRDDDDDNDHADRVSAEGAVAGLTGTCPALSFTVGTTKVTTNAATDFSSDACAALVNGMLVRVRGARQADGSVQATRVHLETVELEGTVSGLTGTCPAITFTVAAQSVTASSATEFKGQTCAEVANGDKVEVKGVQMSSGAVTALKVAEEDDDDEAKVEGTVSGLTGTCPSISFTVGTTKVTANSSTTYEDGTCASVANGKVVEVKGTRQTDGSIAATKVEFE